MARRALLALCVAASAFVRPASRLRTAPIDVAAKKRKKGGKKAGGAAAGGLSGLKVPQLKEMCRDAGLPVGGTKAVLIERLQASALVANRLIVALASMFWSVESPRSTWHQPSYNPSACLCRQCGAPERESPR